MVAHDLETWNKYTDVCTNVINKIISDVCIPYTNLQVHFKMEASISQCTDISNKCLAKLLRGYAYNALL